MTNWVTSSSIGLDIDRLLNTNPGGFPPVNVIEKDDNTWVIELAVAGFAEEDITVEVEESTLRVTGEHDDKDRVYRQRGIATRKFSRSWKLGEYVEVTGADYRNGILSVFLHREVPETKKPKKIKIGGFGGVPEFLSE